MRLHTCRGMMANISIAPEIAQPRVYEGNDRLIYLVAVDIGQQAEVDAMITQIPGTSSCFVLSNRIETGRLIDCELSPRLKQVLQMIRQGMANKSIGGELGISHFTVRNHVSRLLNIYGARNRDELIAFTKARSEVRMTSLGTDNCAD